MTNLQHASWSRVLRWHIRICHEFSRRNSQHPGRNRNKSTEIWTCISFILCIPKYPFSKFCISKLLQDLFLSSIVLEFVFCDFFFRKWTPALCCTFCWMGWNDPLLCIWIYTAKDKTENVATLSHNVLKVISKPKEHCNMSLHNLTSCYIPWILSSKATSFSEKLNFCISFCNIQPHFTRFLILWCNLEVEDLALYVLYWSFLKNIHIYFYLYKPLIL